MTGFVLFLWCKTGSEGFGASGRPACLKPILLGGSLRTSKDKAAAADQSRRLSSVRAPLSSTAVSHRDHADQVEARRSKHLRFGRTNDPTFWAPTVSNYLDPRGLLFASRKREKPWAGDGANHAQFRARFLQIHSYTVLLPYIFVVCFCLQRSS